MNDKEKIHVCHLVYSFNIGGLERVIINCINALDKEKYRHSIVALTNIGEFIQEVDGQIDFYALHKKVGHNFCVHWELYKLLRSIKPDVLHSYNLSTIEYQWVASLLNVNLRVHAEHGRDSYDVDGSVWKYRFLRKAMSPFINTFIAVSKDLSDWLSEDVNIPKRKVSLIANGLIRISFSLSATVWHARERVKVSLFSDMCPDFIRSKTSLLSSNASKQPV